MRERRAITRDRRPKSPSSPTKHTILPDVGEYYVHVTAQDRDQIRHDESAGGPHDQEGRQSAQTLPEPPHLGGGLRRWWHEGGDDDDDDSGGGGGGVKAAVRVRRSESTCESHMVRSERPNRLQVPSSPKRLLRREGLSRKNLETDG